METVYIAASICSKPPAHQRRSNKKLGEVRDLSTVGELEECLGVNNNRFPCLQRHMLL